MNSAYLGNPISLMIRDDKGNQADIINIIMKMVPQSRYQVISNVSPELIFHREQPLKGCCLVVDDHRSFNKMSCHLDPLLGRGSAVMKNSYRTKYGSGIEELKAEGPVSSIVVVKNSKDCALTHPYILWVHPQSTLTHNTALTSRVLDHPSEDIFSVDVAVFRKNMELLKPGLVHVPFAEALAASFNEKDIANGANLFRVIHRMIINTTLINNIAAPSRIDAMANFYGVSEVAMTSWVSAKSYDDHAYRLIESGCPTTKSSASESKMLVATKYDYYLLWALLDGIIGAAGNTLTQRQIRVFESIRKINVERVTGNTFSETETNTDMLISIGRNHDSWSRRDVILKVVNGDGEAELSLADLEMDLKQLVEGGYIEDYRPEGKRERHYYIMTLHTGDSLKLPLPSTLCDPIYHGKPVDVVNPLTGAVEKI